MPIEQKSINMNGEYRLASDLTYNTLRTEVSAFLADTTMGLAKKEQKKVDMKCPVYFYDNVGNEKGHVVVCFTNTNRYIDTLSQFTADTDLRHLFTGVQSGDEAALDDTEEVWSVNISCQLGTDTFQVVFHKKYLAIQNYSDNATATALETYFATRPNLAPEE